MTRIRLFAAARHAIGQAEFTLGDLGLGSPTTVEAVVESLTDRVPDARRVIEGCSVLVDGERRGHDGRIEAAETVDFLPPFAGG